MSTILLDTETKRVGQEKLHRTLKFYEGKYIRNEETNYDTELVSTVANYVVNTDRYKANILNRVDALERLAQDNNLSQLFVTLTLPTEYHPIVQTELLKVKNRKFAHGHIELYDIKTKLRAPAYNKLVFKYYKKDNRRKWTGKIEEISLNPDHYSVKYAYKKLIKMFAKIQKDRAWMKIAKENRIYFYTIEPTMHLVPHMHISIWVPVSTTVSIIKVFLRLYPSPMSHIYTQKIPEEVSDKKQFPGLGKSDKDIVRYVIKYLDELKNEKGEVSNLALWFLANKITPFSFSRTLIPQDIYKKLRGQDTLYNATLKYHNNVIYAWNNTVNKKLMKVFLQDTIIWEKHSCSMYKNAHPLGSSNAKEKEWF